MKIIVYVICIICSLACIKENNFKDKTEERLIPIEFNINNQVSTKSQLSDKNETQISTIDIILFSKKTNSNYVVFEDFTKWGNNSRFKYILSNKKIYYFYVLVNFDLSPDNCPKNFYKITDFKLALPKYSQIKALGMPFCAKIENFHIYNKSKTSFNLQRLMSKYIINVDKSALDNYTLNIHKIKAHNSAIYCKPFSPNGFKATNIEELSSAYVYDEDRTDYEDNISMAVSDNSVSIPIYIAENMQGDLLEKSNYTQSEMENEFIKNNRQDILRLLSYISIDYSLTNKETNKSERKELKYYCGINNPYNFDVKRNQRIGISLIPDNMNIKTKELILDDIVGLDDNIYIAELKDLSIRIRNAYDMDFTIELDNENIGEIRNIQKSKDADDLTIKFKLACLKAGKSKLHIKKNQKIIKSIDLDIMAPILKFDKEHYMLKYNQDNIINLHYYDNNGNRIEEKLDPQLYMQLLDTKIIIDNKQFADILPVKKIGNSFVINTLELSKVLKYDNNLAESLLQIHKNLLVASTSIEDIGIKQALASLSFEIPDKPEELELFDENTYWGSILTSATHNSDMVIYNYINRYMTKNLYNTHEQEKFNLLVNNVLNVRRYKSLVYLKDCKDIDNSTSNRSIFASANNLKHLSFNPELLVYAQDHIAYMSDIRPNQDKLYLEIEYLSNTNKRYKKIIGYFNVFYCIYPKLLISQKLEFTEKPSWDHSSIHSRTLTSEYMDIDCILDKDIDNVNMIDKLNTYFHNIPDEHLLKNEFWHSLWGIDGYIHSHSFPRNYFTERSYKNNTLSLKLINGGPYLTNTENMKSYYINHIKDEVLTPYYRYHGIDKSYILFRKNGDKTNNTKEASIICLPPNVHEEIYSKYPKISTIYR